MMDKFVFWGTDELGNEILLGVPFDIEIKKDKGAVSQLKVSFFATNVWANIRTIVGYYQNQEIFSGIVDEQIWEMSECGYTTEFVARSVDAILLDNEVMPQVIYNPSLKIIEKRFLEPLGFKVISGDLTTMSGEFVVEKGSSAMTVLKSYCQNYLGTEPIITENKEIYCGENPFKKHHVIDKVESFRLVETNYDIISAYYGKNSLSGAYTASYINPSANGISRTRYVDSLGQVDFKIYREITVTTIGFLNANILDTVDIDVGIKGGVIESIVYKINGDGKTTKLVLKEEKTNVDF